MLYWINKDILCIPFDLAIVQLLVYYFFIPRAEMGVATSNSKWAKLVRDGWLLLPTVLLMPLFVAAPFMRKMENGAELMYFFTWLVSIFSVVFWGIILKKLSNQKQNCVSLIDDVQNS